MQAEPVTFDAACGFFEKLTDHLSRNDFDPTETRFIELLADRVHGAYFQPFAKMGFAANEQPRLRAQRVCQSIGEGRE